jgi:hypothetical protein
MSNLNSRIKKAKAALDKAVPKGPVKMFFSEDTEFLTEEETQFLEQNPDYDGEVLTICWHDPNAINYEDA